MFEQRAEEGREQPVASEGADEVRIAEAPPRTDGFRCYSLELLLQLED